MASRRRISWTSSSDPDIHAKFKELADITGIPISRLMDEAMRDLIVKYEDIRKQFEEKDKENTHP